jgi:hypothetical protein
MATIVLLCGCQTDHHRSKTDKKADKKISALRVHLESSANDTGLTQIISLLRADPVQVTIMRDPILTEASIIAARVITAQGGFAIEVKFDESATLMLEQYSAANPGRHLAIFGQWGDKLVNGRWLAAPLITHRINDGTLTFTADCSRDEADQLVLGLNNVGKKNLKALTK